MGIVSCVTYLKTRGAPKKNFNFCAVVSNKFALKFKRTILLARRHCKNDFRWVDTAFNYGKFQKVPSNPVRFDTLSLTPIITNPSEIVFHQITQNSPFSQIINVN